MIKSKDILRVIENFKKVLPKAQYAGHLKMSCPWVKTHVHKCGTIHCHAGWYGVATCNLTKEFVGFGQGGNNMGKDLGLKNMVGLMNWAANNAELWGNNCGDGIFGDERAFMSPTRPNGAENLQDIIDHWEEVYNRVKAMEDKEKYEDITKELAVLPVDEVPDIKEVKELIN